MSYIDFLLMHADEDELEEAYRLNRHSRRNPFSVVESVPHHQPIEESMSIEQRTRAEVIKALIAVSDALALILQEREHGEEIARSTNEFAPPPAPPVEKKPRAKKEKPAPQPEPLGPPLTSEHEMNAAPVKMADIKPTKPGKTLADLRVALQECINKHGMPGAKERLAPHAKISDVPDAEIAEVIARLAAE